MNYQLTIGNLEITLVPRHVPTGQYGDRSWAAYDAFTRVYVTLANDPRTFGSDAARIKRSLDLYRTLVRDVAVDALKKLHSSIETAEVDWDEHMWTIDPFDPRFKIRFSWKAGCSCGCSCGCVTNARMTWDEVNMDIHVRELPVA